MTSQPTGCVTSCDPRTAEAGAAMLRAGGTAVDAIVAAAAMASVVEYSLVSLGSGGIAMVLPEPGATPRVLDFFVQTPGLGGSPKPLPGQPGLREVFIDFGTEKQPFHIGSCSVAVPGVVAGLYELHQRDGKLPWADVLAPAIAMAAQPIQVSRFMWQNIVRMVYPILTDTAESAGIFGRKPHDAPDGVATVHQPDLAHSLELIANQGPSVFYRGEIAEKLLAQQRAGGGLITQQDLESYAPIPLQPRKLTYRDATVYLPPGPSWGGRLIAFTLELLDAVSADGGSRSAQQMRALAEAMAMTDRERANCGEDLDQLNDRKRVDRCRRELRMRCADEAHTPATMSPHGSPHTTHISAMDANGMAAGLTFSTGVGSGIVIPGTGIILNNMLGESDLSPAGFHSRPAGQRFSTMMTPCIVTWPNGDVAMLGSAGSNRIRSAIVQTIVRLVDDRLELDHAVNAPRLHHERGKLHLESTPKDGDDVAIAKALGYNVVAWPEPSIYFGGLNAVMKKNGQIVGAADRRREGGVSCA